MRIVYHRQAALERARPHYWYCPCKGADAAALAQFDSDDEGNGSDGSVSAYSEDSDDVGAAGRTQFASNAREAEACRRCGKARDRFNGPARFLQYPVDASRAARVRRYRKFERDLLRYHNDRVHRDARERQLARRDQEFRLVCRYGWTKRVRGGGGGGGGRACSRHSDMPAYMYEYELVGSYYT